jgi:alpha-L-rhamnosidase
MLSVLNQYDQENVAYTMIDRTDYPSYGYMVANNATTLWEVWWFDNDTYSHNHEMFAAVSEYFVKNVAGIAPHPLAGGEQLN